LQTMGMRWACRLTASLFRRRSFSFLHFFQSSSGANDWPLRIWFRICLGGLRPERSFELILDVRWCLRWTFIVWLKKQKKWKQICNYVGGSAGRWEHSFVGRWFGKSFRYPSPQQPLLYPNHFVLGILRRVSLSKKGNSWKSWKIKFWPFLHYSFPFPSKEGKTSG
jgi:hypothetical protein